MREYLYETLLFKKREWKFENLTKIKINKFLTLKNEGEKRTFQVPRKNTVSH